MYHVPSEIKKVRSADFNLSAGDSGKIEKFFFLFSFFPFFFCFFVFFRGHPSRGMDSNPKTTYPIPRTASSAASVLALHASLLLFEWGDRERCEGSCMHLLHGSSRGDTEFHP